MPDDRDLRDFDEFAAWAAGAYDGQLRLTVFTVLPSAGGGAMAAPHGVDLYARLIDVPTVLESARGVPERYLSFAFDGGGHLAIPSAMFERASIVDEGRSQAIVYMIDGLAVTISPDDSPRSTTAPASTREQVVTAVEQAMRSAFATSVPDDDREWRAEAERVADAALAELSDPTDPKETRPDG